jgi:hypothetical protein
MKTTTVPAQVTSVEDKIAGSLTLSQLLLLVMPLFVGSAIYVLIPPVLHLSAPKLGISLVILSVAGVAAIRIRGKLVLFWVVILARYAARPKYYVATKNDLYLRELPGGDGDGIPEVEPAVDPTLIPLVPATKMTSLQRLKLEAVLADPRAKLHFRTNRKGNLRVHITEVE